MPLTPAEKQRRYRERRKKDLVKEAEAKQKDLARYHAKKKVVKDMTPREHRRIKRKWRIANSKRRDRQKALRIVMATPESSPGISSSRLPSPTNRSETATIPRLATPDLDTPRRLSTPILIRGSLRNTIASPILDDRSKPSPASQRGRKQIKRNRTKLCRDNLKLKEELDIMKKKYEKYKKRYNRAKRSEEPNNDDKYVALSNAIKDRYKKVKSVKEKITIQKIFEENPIISSKKKTEIIRNSVLNQGYFRRRQPIPRQNILKSTIQTFFNRDDVSRATAGKKETVTWKKAKMQKRYLLDSMKNLYQSFKREHVDRMCSYSYFVRNKPFYVKPPSVDERDTCLCRLHTNIQYMVNVLHKNKLVFTSDLNIIIQETVCNVHSLTCMSNTCSFCKSKNYINDISIDKEQQVHWPQWVRKTEIVEKSGKKFQVSKNVKEVIQSTLQKLIDSFEKTLIQFKRHVYNIKTQYKNYRDCIDGLTDQEIALHVDFAENYSGKCFEEIQSHHFGGSRNQVSLHTGVMYRRDQSQEIEITPFCSVSENITHNPCAIWAHLHPIFSLIQDRFPQVKTLHIFSDGPATQYRQKQNFYLICNRLFLEYTFLRVTWNFFEAGHGKGAADGVGGFLKRTADQIVAVGRDILNANDFYQALKAISKIRLYLITNEDIECIAKDIPGSIRPLVGTMKVHQVFTEEKGMLKYRDLSCFCQRGFCDCLNPKCYFPLEAPVTVSTSILERDTDILSNITNLIQQPRRSLYKDIYSSNSDSEDEIPLFALKDTDIAQQGSCSIDHSLIEKENIHPYKIKAGVYVLVKVSSNKSTYTYLGVALSEVDEDGELKIMFLKCVDKYGKTFKTVETDVSYEPYENLMKIVPTPKKIYKGKRVYYEFDTPLEVFEK